MRLGHGPRSGVLGLALSVNACMPEGSSADDGDTRAEDTSAAATSDTGTMTGETSSSEGATGTDTHTETDGTSGSDTGTTTLSTTGETSQGSEASSDSTTGEPTQACIDGCAVEFECGSQWRSVQECEAWCEDNLVAANLFSTYCRDAWEGLHACIGSLTCEEYEAYLAGGNAFPCDAAFYTLELECAGQA